MMEYKNMPGIPRPLSALAYGTPGTATRPADREQAFRSYDLAWEYGFRVFDTAHSYGAGEETLGLWLTSRGHRDEAVILDKGCDPGRRGSTDVFSARTVREQLEGSLRLLRTDHVDLYILHRDDPSVPVDEVVEELNRLKQEGKLLLFGGSNWTYERVLAANAYADAKGLTGFSAVSPAYSLARYIFDPWGGSVSLSGEGQAPYREWLTKSQLPVFCYSPLGRGYLSGKFRTDGDVPIENCIGMGAVQEYDCPLNRERLRRAEMLAREKNCSVSRICLKWLLCQPMNIIPIVAPSTREHIRDNVSAPDIPLTRSEAEWLTAAEEV